MDETLVLDLWNAIGPFLSLSLGKTNGTDRLPAVGAFLQFWVRCFGWELLLDSVASIFRGVRFTYFSFSCFWCPVLLSRGLPTMGKPELDREQMVLGCWPPGSCSVLRQQSASSLLSSALELRIFSREWFISFTFSNYVYFRIIYSVLSWFCESLLCLLPRPFFAPDGANFCLLCSPDNPDWMSSGFTIQSTSSGFLSLFSIIYLFINFYC